MKKIINGKKYDTETAKECGIYSNGLPISNFSYVRETLYRKNNGEFFVHGQGGAYTQYGVSCGQNCWGDGEQILPLTINNAMQWAERYLDADEYEAIFGEVEE